MIIRRWLLVSRRYEVNDKKEFFEYAGAAGGFIDKYGYPFCGGV